MNKKSINKYLKKFGVEIHGTGHMNKLLSKQQRKNSFECQAEILNHHASVIFDIGANKGLTTSEYLKFFPAAEIHAFEPFSEYFSLWEQIAFENKNVHFNALGLFDKNGKIAFHINNDHDTNSILKSTKIGATSDKHCQTVGEATIDIITLSEYCLEHGIDAIDILKLDTQGSELAVLRGGENLLTNKKIKLIFCETYFKQQYVDQPLLFDIAQYLKGFGYYVQDFYDPYFNDRFLLMCDTIFVAES